MVAAARRDHVRAFRPLRRAGRGDDPRQNDIYFQIGLVVLIGLAAKNAILIVEFAAQKRAEGMQVLEARPGGRASALPAGSS